VWNKSFIFLKRFIAKEVCTACSRTGYKIVPLTKLNKYSLNETSETEVNINKEMTAVKNSKTNNAT